MKNNYNSLNTCSAAAAIFAFAVSGSIASSSVEIPRTIGKKASIPTSLQATASISVTLPAMQWFLRHISCQASQRPPGLFPWQSDDRTTFPCHNHICILHLSSSIWTASRISCIPGVSSPSDNSEMQIQVRLPHLHLLHSGYLFANHFGSNLCIVFHACIQNRKDIGGNSLYGP